MGIASGVFTVFCALVMPIGSAIYLCSRKKGLWKPVVVGAVTFLVFQILFRIPILQLVLPNMQWYLKMSITQPLLSALFIGATAGLVEELGRFITMRLFLKNNLHVMDGIAFGVGHGGIEAILLAGTNALITLIAASQSIVPGLMFAGGIERVAVIVIHISWSVMVMKSVREKKIMWLLLTLITHTLIDSGAVYASSHGISIWIIEGALIICVLLALIFITKEYREKEKY